MPSREYYLAQAELLINLASTVSNVPTRNNLLALAQELKLKSQFPDDDFPDPCLINKDAGDELSE